jgi:phosphatidate cytidylyltransferase
VSEALRKRIVTAVVLAGTFIAILFLLPPLATVLVVTGMVIAGAWEWSAFLRLRTAALRLGYVALVATLLYVAWRFSFSAHARELLLAIAVLWWLTALVWVMRAPRQVPGWAAALAGVLALVPSWLALVLLRHAPQGADWVLFALVLVFVADIGAFFAGRRFGRLRLAPDVSPGKTWEGAVGGIALSALVAVAGSVRFDVPLAQFLPLCLAAVAFSIVGDLTESLLKRSAGLKDSGSILPGHGGVMDRIDSITGAAPVLLLGLTLMGVLA